MPRLLLALPFLALSAPSHAADLAPSFPCAQPQVLLLVKERVQRAGLPTEIEAGSIGELPGGTPGTVHCALRLHTPLYDTNRFGYAPQDQVATFRYTLELRRNAIFFSPG